MSSALRRDDAVVEPAHDDTFVRGLSEAIGGPLGEHAVRRRRWDRLRSPAAIVLMLGLLTFGVHFIQKYPCQSGAWNDYSQYRHFCYTDVLALYYSEELHEGKVPYFDHPVEYPVLTGAFMGVIGLPVHNYALTHPNASQAQIFYNLNAIVLIAFGMATLAAVLALRRRRPWDAAMLAVAPAMFFTATINWDLFAIGLTTFFLCAWARRMPVLAGVLLGLAAAAKFYPLFLAGPLLLLALRTNRWRAALTTVFMGAVAWAAVNAPVFFAARDGWDRFWSLSKTRGIDWGTLWYIFDHFPRGKNQYGFEWAHRLAGDIPRLNTVYEALFVLGCLGIAVLALMAPRRPRLAQLCFLVIAVFLLTSKVWSQQFVLWVIPLAVLARPRWGAFLAWQVAEVCYFLAFYGELLNASGKSVFPEGVFVLASSLRWLTLAALVGAVVWDILQPERDVVRDSYGEDPDGGEFQGAPDVDWVQKLRTAEPFPIRA